jgi:hypothetical protein
VSVADVDVDVIVGYLVIGRVVLLEPSVLRRVFKSNCMFI